jgi:hypothetical protein
MVQFKKNGKNILARYSIQNAGMYLGTQTYPVSLPRRELN